MSHLFIQLLLGEFGVVPFEAIEAIDCISMTQMGKLWVRGVRGEPIVYGNDVLVQYHSLMLSVAKHCSKYFIFNPCNSSKRSI